MRRHLLFLLCIFFLNKKYAHAQNEYSNPEFQFLSYSKIPTWTGVATEWDSHTPQIHLYDCYTFVGHAEYVSRGLKTGITFKQFRESVKDFKTRKYLPFFLYDLRNCPATIGGKKFLWAVRIEDYGYSDTDAEMTETVSKLLNHLTSYIHKHSGQKSHGLILLGSNPASKPNTSITNNLAQKHVNSITIQKLLSLTGSPRVSILNEGIAYGYLHYIPAGMENKIFPSPDDIVVYERIPERIPPVAGIITMEPQTPLSHINLLAKNRNTVNLYAMDLSMLNLKGKKGKLVKLECKDSTVSIKPARESDAKKSREARKQRILLPEINLSVEKIQDLIHCDSSVCNTWLIGAKAFNYRILCRSFPEYVRPGYAIPFARYFQTIKRCGADSMINSFLKAKSELNPEIRIQKLKLIRERILNSTPDPLFLKEVKALADTKFKNSRIRLRSSTNCEDLPEFNGAGLYLSKGYTCSDSVKILEQKILEVYASLWSFEAFSEREYYQIDHSNVAMGILINEAYTHEYANGVAVTIPDKSGYALLINTQPEDHLITNPENGEIAESILFPDVHLTNFTVESRSSIQDIFLLKEHATLLSELKKVSIQIHALLISTNKNLPSAKKYGVDIEFRIMKEHNRYKLYIKQARLLGSTLPE